MLSILRRKAPRVAPALPTISRICKKKSEHGKGSYQTRYFDVKVSSNKGGT